MIRLSRSIVGREELSAVERVLLEDGYLGMGSEVQAFENDIAEYLAVANDRVVCVNSGTAALHLAVEAVTKPGDEIIVPSLTYLASFQAISAGGALPVACDVCESNATIDLEDAARKLTPRTRAIMPVHYASYAPQLDEIYSFADAHGLRVIEDAAHAFGCLHRGRRIGSHGDVVCFSFDGIKNITSGEGGAIVSRDLEVCRLVRDCRLLGVEKDSEKRYRGQRSWEFDVSRQGYRYHMSNIMAAMGRVQLSRLDSEFAPKRRQLAAHYRDIFEDSRKLRFFESDQDSVVPHILPLRILENRRDDLRKHLEENGVQTGIHYKPNHLLKMYGSGVSHLPITEMLYGQLLSLPLHPGLTIQEVDRICELVLSYL